MPMRKPIANYPLRFVAVLAAVQTMGGAAHANTFEIFSSFGSGDSVDRSVSYPIAGPANLAIGQTEYAFAFTAAAPGRATTVEVALEQNAGPGFDVLVTLAADASGEPGSILGTGSAALPAITITRSRVVSVVLESPSTVNAETAFWIGLSTIGAAEFRWHANDQGLETSVANSVDGRTSWSVLQDSPTPAARILGVPEPSAAVILCSAILSCGTIAARW